SPGEIAYDSAKGEVFVPNGGDGTVSVINDVSNSVTNTITVGNNPTDIAYDSAKGEVFVANSNDGTVSVINDVSNSVTNTITVGNNPTDIAYDSAKGEVFVTNQNDGTVSVINDGSNSLDSTTTSASPNPSSIVLGQTIKYTVTVTDTNSPSSTLGGTITFSDNDALGTFNPPTCTLSTGSCATSYTPSNVGPISITATYSGDSSHLASAGVSQLTVSIPNTLQTKKGSLANDITNLESGITDKSTLKILDSTALHIQNSISKNLWNADGNTLNSNTGRKVFNEEAGAVDELEKLIGAPPSHDHDMKDADDSVNDADLANLKTQQISSAFASAANTIVYKLVGIDKSLAHNEIKAAMTHYMDLKSHHADKKIIKKIEGEIHIAVNGLEKGKMDTHRGQLHRAIYDYRDAWVHAENAANLS
ncbi:MAG: Ig-like domain repeat protein, partial [Thaumarchaeota archaeon]|nr:Ig-like domain repeat protein [Nitrososphaerota archaeon]